jgi:hypothetical protein
MQVQNGRRIPKRTLIRLVARLSDRQFDVSWRLFSLDAFQEKAQHSEPMNPSARAS